MKFNLLAILILVSSCIISISNHPMPIDRDPIEGDLFEGDIEGIIGVCLSVY